MDGRRFGIGLAVGFAGGLAAGLVVWSERTRRARHELFSGSASRRSAALSHVSGQRSMRTVLLLRDYVHWERDPRLRRRGEGILRRMEHSLD